MKWMQQKSTIVFLIAVLHCLFTTAFSQTTMHFKLVFNEQNWHTDSSYTNKAGESLQINRLMFYTSKWKMVNANNDTIPLSNEHFLMDANNAQSLALVFTIASNAKKILFNLGVDSIRNTTGIQTGILDPAKGMFWTWRSGYIMAKLHGVAATAKTAGNRFSYEVGGFEFPYNSVRTIELVIPLLQQKNKHYTILTDLAKWFNGKHLINISENPNCHNAGKLAMQLADNYSTMFSIQQHP